MDFGNHYLFRGELVDSLTRDLVGPLECDPADELITDAPITRYVAGVLFPRDEGNIDPSQDIPTNGNGSEGAKLDETSPDDPPVAMANVRYPSSMGLTFAVDSRRCSGIVIKVSAARYESIERGPSGEEQWKRILLPCAPVDINVLQPVEDKRQEVADGLQLFYRVRRADPDGIVSVTVVLINVHKRPAIGLRDGLCFFQPRIRVEGHDIGDSPFVSRRGRIPDDCEADILSSHLLYRDTAAIAVGHGCSVEWTDDRADSLRATTVATSFVPSFELLLADTNPAIDGPHLSMTFLAQGERTLVLQGLRRLASGYESWITDLRTEPIPQEPGLASAATKHIEGCTLALERIRAGIDALESNADMWDSFRLANRAMLEQRSRTVWLKSGRTSPAPIADENHRWRPFQLAFILLCIESIGNPMSADRDTADLLWFPTGGGKTEAYLGLVAFTVFLRRLRRGATSAGVTVIMRYTLRLLTIQQFERAALLICCCEYVRRSHRTLSAVPITVGLWVGQGGTPNTLANTRIALDRLGRGDSRSIEGSNPMQLQSCPWCGELLTIRNYYIANQQPRLVVACRCKGCEFESGLPVYLIDEDIYNYRPTLLIATADKFASLPWRDKVASIFGNKGECDPPELIIQDELHLISGPLGTLTGLYETAVDALCTKGCHRAKVIASTATIRRADSQTRGLFDRPVAQFPPPGLRVRDSYFAVEASRKTKGTRLYVGVMAPAVSQTTLLVRVYAALLHYAATLQGDPAVRDAYWTLVGYFNSLRVLGGARMQVQDDVTERIALLAHTAGTSPRAIDNRIELTSREPSGEIPAHLQRMSVALPSDDAIDVILATNMISVGVDVDRLGLMAVMGQPQSTSEYIQATSRVGRQTPGLVVTIFNAARSRDRSHYESFVEFHSTLYRQVEATSVTPFSARARDRGLHAVLVSLARLMIPELRSNEAAASVAQHLDKLHRVKELIVQRVTNVAADEAGATSEQIDQIIQEWVQRAGRQANLVYQDFKNPDRALLVDMAGEHGDDGLPTLWSLRDVDMSSNLYLVR
jgi:hypothetical protein